MPDWNFEDFDRTVTLLQERLDADPLPDGWSIWWSWRRAARPMGYVGWMKYSPARGTVTLRHPEHPSLEITVCGERNAGRGWASREAEALHRQLCERLVARLGVRRLGDGLYGRGHYKLPSALKVGARTHNPRKSLAEQWNRPTHADEVLATPRGLRTTDDAPLVGVPRDMTVAQLCATRGWFLLPPQEL